jgi:predicted DNA-binding antitoxin AbrB/MazE fold protein
VQDEDVSAVIRAVVQNGLTRPLDPLPLGWTEGRMVIVEDADSAISEDLEAWYDELRRLGPAQYEPGEREQIRAIIAKADAQAKDVVRREMESR